MAIVSNDLLMVSLYVAVTRMWAFALSLANQSSSTVSSETFDSRSDLFPKMQKGTSSAPVVESWKRFYQSPIELYESLFVVS